MSGSTPKYLRLTLDVQLGERNQHANRINQAADAAIAAATEALEENLLEGSIVNVEQGVEFSYRWIARTSWLGGTAASDEDEL
ncbi:hypothetical protein ACGFI5_00280 [Micromonospora tulbaghiae]|uniref:hypothetical protein n=1 Tax=Micromonospora TaxID=1873 RepID=UPI002252A7E1|nr:hypothetical protein [Micromonospora sp. NBC_01655]MCX4471769.1 hypothetical protein [Micromonospora sp. NBC_01655]